MSVLDNQLISFPDDFDAYKVPAYCDFMSLHVMARATTQCCPNASFTHLRKLPLSPNEPALLLLLLLLLLNLSVLPHLVPFCCNSSPSAAARPFFCSSISTVASLCRAAFRSSSTSSIMARLSADSSTSARRGCSSRSRVGATPANLLLVLASSSSENHLLLRVCAREELSIDSLGDFCPDMHTTFSFNGLAQATTSSPILRQRHAASPGTSPPVGTALDPILARISFQLATGGVGGDAPLLFGSPADQDGDTAASSPTSDALNVGRKCHQGRSGVTSKSDAAVVKSLSLVPLVPAWRVAALLHVSYLFWTRATLLVVSIGWITSAPSSPYIYQSSDSIGLDIRRIVERDSGCQVRRCLLDSAQLPHPLRAPIRTINSTLRILLSGASVGEGLASRAVAPHVTLALEPRLCFPRPKFGRTMERKTDLTGSGIHTLARRHIPIPPVLVDLENGDSYAPLALFLAHTHVRGSH
ncbi:hypothetical protein B0H16DRAFT_1726252 [Mycena metata]|uniref:Uncharacterized protein n=1 Tax=Mycena metata TaxID=1033252 RepID=A0AAD7N604_9AGAR|nr:hypothetical protein B0H16DRAFT_1726237 [Mycena metata]KAJ7747060.1 hypothetical protein B0H16DRAFT_1726252 [Mycena metata]